MHPCRVGFNECTPSNFRREIGLDRAAIMMNLVDWATVLSESRSEIKVVVWRRAEPVSRPDSLATAFQFLATLESAKTSNANIIAATNENATFTSASILITDLKLSTGK